MLCGVRPRTVQIDYGIHPTSKLTQIAAYRSRRAAFIEVIAGAHQGSSDQCLDSFRSLHRVCHSRTYPETDKEGVRSRGISSLSANPPCANRDLSADSNAFAHVAVLQGYGRVMWPEVSVVLRFTGIEEVNGIGRCLRFLNRTV